MRYSRLLSLAAVALISLIAVAAATAGTITTTATITGTAGLSLNLPSNPSISDTLDGTDQTVTYGPVLGIVDARGTGAGWNLTISATNFSDGAGHTLAPGTVTATAQACHSGSTCTAATNTVTYPLTITGVAAKAFNAAATTGIGKVDVTPTIGVSIPGNTFAGTYTSTVTLAVATGP